MAQTNYTPISLYYSTTASAVPTAANLVPGELAINTNDGKLYYEDSAGVVQVLATKSTGSIGGSNTQVQFNNSGSLGGSSSFTWDGTTVTATKFAGALNGTVGATTASTGAFTTLSTSSTTTFSGLTASTALALDASKNVVSVTNTGTGNNVLSASPTLTGTIAGASLSLSSLTSGRVTYAGTAGLLQDSSNLTFDGNGNLSVTGTGNSVFTLTGSAGVSKFSFVSAAGTQFISTGVGGSNNMVFAINNTETMRLTSTGLGIGTSSPSWPLDVQKSSDGIVGYFRRVGATVNPALYITANETGNTVGFGTDYAGATSPAMTFTTGGTERMRIDSTGVIGIGITTAGSNAGVFSQLQIGGTSTADSRTILYGQKNASAGGIISNGYYDASNNLVYSQTYGVSQLYLNNGTFIFSNAASGTAGTNVTVAEAMRIDSSGNLLVGGTSQIGKISGYFDGATVSGVGLQTSKATTGSNFIVFNNSSGATAGYINHNGTTTVNYVTSSDYRLKINIVDAPSGNIDDIKVRSFDWIADGSHQEYGMVAQELLEVAPYAVSKPENPDEMMGVDYSKLVPMMIKEIQDLKQRIATLENK